MNENQKNQEQATAQVVDLQTLVRHCTNCKGSGKQIFHGHFESIVGTCNFCNGSGKREDQLNCLNHLS